MKCPQCQHENPQGARFCEECAAPLTRACPNCGTLLSATAKFCHACAHPLAAGEGTQSRFASPEAYTPKHLAEKILTSRSSLEGERKIVTVLFVDVSGFTALSERLDPEDVHQLMDDAFELMLAEIHRYEGTVNQFLGDGLMALFGAPLAHEDHSLRGVQAALGIRRALAGYHDRLKAERQIDFQVRMGMNTGSVVVGKIGDNLRMDYTAVGDTTNLAARLLALAEPGHLLVSEEVSRAVGPYLVLQPLGEVVVKGKTLPVRAYRVEAARDVRSRIEAASELGLTPLVGREREIALLDDRFNEVREGRGQVVFVFGEAGIGKSRLLAEFRRRAATVGGARWVVGRCVSYGQSISYLPVLDVIRDLFAIQEADSVEAVIEKLDIGIPSVGNDLAWTTPFIRSLLSLDPGDADVVSMNPSHRHGRTAEALRALIAKLGQRGSVVLLVEDLHWIDPQSEELIHLVLEGIATLPVLVLLTYRPGYAQPFGDQTYYTRITLHGLPEAQSRAMVEGVLRGAEVPPAVRDLITQKAEGNPLFVEELSKALIEDGTLQRDNGGYRLARPLGEGAIPDTIQGVIMARIDRLPEASKSALQIASVIGREFTARLVERVAAMERAAPRALGEVRAVELIYEKSVYPELAYMFKHALTHDVAYESLIKQRRRTLHRRVGDVIEELYADRLPEFYETLAWHYGQGEAWAKAVHYLLEAATKARGQYAYSEAIRHCQRAGEILDRQGGAAAETLRAFELLGDLESLQGQIASANGAYQRACEASDDASSRQRIANKRHRRGSAVRDGAKIAYYEHGDGEPTLLLMHPLAYGISTFQPLVEALCQEFRVVTVDPRGTGESDPGPSVYLIRDHVEDARAVVGAIGDRPVVFIGLSRSGAIAVNFAVTYPKLLEKLVLMSTAPTLLTAPEFPGPVDREWVERLVTELRAEHHQNAMRIMYTQIFSEAGSRNLIESGIEAGTRLPLASLRNYFRPDDPGIEIRPLLPRIQMPTLVLHGTEDRVIPLEAMRYVTDRVPGAQLYLFKGRGHGLFATAVGEFARVVRNFVRTGHPA